MARISRAKGVRNRPPWESRGFCEVHGAKLRALRERTSLKILWGGGQRPSSSQSEVATTHSGDGHAVNS
jgi:hypothetical protein